MSINRRSKFHVIWQMKIKTMRYQSACLIIDKTLTITNAGGDEDMYLYTNIHSGIIHISQR